jgi:branched-chain amino acid transport system ATP-binding protein
MTDKPILNVRNLDVHYGDLQAVWNVSLDVNERQIVSVIGANGAGKTTLLKTIAGALRPTRGTIEFKGRDITVMKPFQTVADGIALVPEGRRIFPRLSVRENLLIGAHTPRARKNIDHSLNIILKLFPILEQRANQMGTNLSGGEQQMLAIGRALMSEPSLILFDEISLGLAPLIIKSIYEKVRDINKEGITIVLVEQDIKRSLKACSMAYIMLEGKLVLSGNPGDLTEEQVRKAYFGI